MNNGEIEEIVERTTKLWHRFGGKTILITGCCGFLGKIFTHYFLSLNKVLSVPCHVIGTDNFIIGLPKPDVDDKNYTFLNHDVCVPMGTKISNDIHIDFIINCCGIANPKIYADHPIETFNVSSIGTQNMLELAYRHKSESVLLFSSSEIYSTPTVIPTPELPYAMAPFIGERAAYDQGKVIILMFADIFHRCFKVNVKTVLPFNVFSSDMSLKDDRVIPSYIRSALSNKPITVYGEGKETRTFCYATDFICGALQVLLNGKNGDYYNLGNSDNEISMIDLANLIQRVTGTEGLVQKVPYPDVYKTQPQRRCPDLTKVKNAVGYSPVVSLEEGIKRYWEWAKLNYIFSFK